MSLAPKWRRRSADRPDEILDAALDVFAARGFESARVEDVAARAGLSKGAVYLYFRSKEDILRALIEREVAPFVGRVEALAAAGVDDPEAAIRMIVAGLETAIAETTLFAVPKIVLSAAARFPEIADYYRTHVVERALAALAGLYRTGLAAGKFRKVDDRAAARLFLGPTLLEAMRVRLLGGAKGPEAPAARANAHLDIVFAGLKAQAT